MTRIFEQWIGVLCALAFGVVGSVCAVDVQLVANGLSNPVAITHAGDGSGRLFITLQAGKIMIFDGAQMLPAPFLDITTLVKSGGEQGLLSVAFHPHYATNGLFYVDFTNLAGDTVISRYKVSADPNMADTQSGTFVLYIHQPFDTHNGGQLQFGPDGYLYISMGDGGGLGDPPNNAQNLQTLLGKLLRIDVDGGSPYAIPPTNPFFGSQTVSNEIWAVGLRNPWRFSFDRLTGDLFIGDVGQDKVEEINFQPANSFGGDNYGWRLMEGSLCYNPTSNCNNASLVLPILEYDHSQGCAVIGGYRYRGTQAPTLGGKYIYGDLCNGRIWAGTQIGSNIWTSTGLLDTGLNISTFGEDEAGEIYFAHRSATNGAIYGIVAPITAVHDLAITRLRSPKTIKLSATKPSRTKRVVVQIQNRSPQDETICSLTNLVTVVVQPLGTNCPAPSIVLSTSPQEQLPVVLKSKQKLNVYFDVVLDCVNDPARGAGHEDFQYTATVNHAAIDGNEDTHPECDVCPRGALPGGVDPNPDGTIRDKGCGGKKPDGTLGAAVLTDVATK